MDTLPVYKEQDKKILAILSRLTNTRWRITLLAAVMVVVVYCALPVSVISTSGLNIAAWTSSSWQNADILQHVDTLIGTYGPGTEQILHPCLQL